MDVALIKWLPIYFDVRFNQNVLLTLVDPLSR